MLVENFLFEGPTVPNKRKKEFFENFQKKYTSNDFSYHITFTQVDKVGINPQSQYGTPLAVCAYPLTKEIFSQFKTNSLPFAGGSPYVSVLKVKTPNFYLVSDPYIHELFKKFVDNPNDIITLLKKNGYNENDYLDQYGGLKDFDKANLTARSNRGTPIKTSTFWNYLRLFCRSQKKPSVVWNKILQSLGIDALCDEGFGFLHPAEPSQTMFFKPGSYEVIERFENPNSNERIEKKEKTAENFSEFNSGNSKIDKIDKILTLQFPLLSLNSLFGEYGPPIDYKKVKYFFEYLLKTIPKEQIKNLYFYKAIKDIHEKILDLDEEYNNSKKDSVFLFQELYTRILNELNELQKLGLMKSLFQNFEIFPASSIDKNIDMVFLIEYISKLYFLIREKTYYFEDLINSEQGSIIEILKDLGFKESNLALSKQEIYTKLSKIYRDLINLKQMIYPHAQDAKTRFYVFTNPKSKKKLKEFLLFFDFIEKSLSSKPSVENIKPKKKPRKIPRQVVANNKIAQFLDLDKWK